MNLISHRSPAAASYIQRNILSPKRNVTACVIYYSASNKEVNTQKIASAASEIKSQTPADTTSKITAPEPDATVATSSTTTSTETSSLQPLVLAESSTPIVTSKKRPHHPIFALKTDLLLWAGVMPNFKLGAWSPNLTGELYFARRWSVQFGWSYANWNALYGSKELHAISAGDLEARFWLGKASQFKGFFVGTYGIFGDYDIQQGINNTLQANTGTFWSAGVGVGWLLPLSRCWALEGQLRGGYRSASNKLYDKVGEYHCLNSRNEANVFDVQLRVNIVWRFNSTKQ